MMHSLSGLAHNMGPIVKVGGPNGGMPLTGKMGMRSLQHKSDLVITWATSAWVSLKLLILPARQL